MFERTSIGKQVGTPGVLRFAFPGCFITQHFSGLGVLATKWGAPLGPPEVKYVKSRTKPLFFDITRVFLA